MDELTPIEQHDGIWYKRDDYFRPYDDFDVCGGKVRQCISLMKENQKLSLEEKQMKMMDIIII